jgi:hypothetical protein
MRAFWLYDPFDPRQMKWQASSVAIAGSGLLRGWLHERLGLLVRGVEKALGNFDIFQRKIILFGAEFFQRCAESRTPQIAEDTFQAPPRFFRLGQRCLMLRKAHLRLSKQLFEDYIFFVERRNVHAPFYASG